MTQKRKSSPVYKAISDSKHSMSPGVVRCPECNAYCALNEDGCFRNHNVGVLSRNSKRCRGSGTKP
jgi:hypothetical protein